MRDVILDCETTGLDPKVDRIVEIGAIRKWDGARFHRVINPQRRIPRVAWEIHGIKDEHVYDSPVFGEIAAEFHAFIADADRLVAHNAAFDMSFIEAEFRRLTLAFPRYEIVDTLDMARRKFPNSRSNTLDALCKRLGISLKRRKNHGALLDCELLLEVYGELLEGPAQAKLDLFIGNDTAKVTEAASVAPRPSRTILLTPAELAAHSGFISTLKTPIWNSFSQPVTKIQEAA